MQTPLCLTGPGDGARLRLEKTEPVDNQLSGFARWFLADIRTDGVHEDAGNIAVSHA